MEFQEKRFGEDGIVCLLLMLLCDRYRTYSSRCDAVTLCCRCILALHIFSFRNFSETHNSGSRSIIKTYAIDS